MTYVSVSHDSYRQLHRFLLEAVRRFADESLAISARPASMYPILQRTIQASVDRTGHVKGSNAVRLQLLADPALKWIQSRSELVVTGGRCRPPACCLLSEVRRKPGQIKTQPKLEARHACPYPPQARL